MQGNQNELPIINPDLTGGVCFGVNASGECFCKGFGNIDKENVEAIAKALILMAARLRNSARTPPSSWLLN
jgi:hypothetical protein